MIASAQSNISSAGRNSCSRLPARTIVAVPPATVTLNPRVSRPSTVSTRAFQPMSLMADADVILGAAFKSDLELARQHRAQRVAQEITRQRFRIRRDVERLVLRDAGSTGTR